MTYDDWKQVYPWEWDYQEEKECSECGKPLKDGHKGCYCSDKCACASML